MIQTPLTGHEAALIGLAVLAVIVPQPSWQVVRHLQVMAHEGTHAVVGSLSGRKVHSIELKDNADGGTDVRPTTGPGYLVAAFVGYLGPSAFGLGAAKLITYGHIITVLWLAVLLLVFLLFTLKPSFGLVTVPLSGLLLVLVLRRTPQAFEVITAYVITWMLLLAGVRRVFDILRESGDSDLLRSRTGVPHVIWLALWLAGTLAAAVIGARWLIHPAVT